MKWIGFLSGLVARERSRGLMLISHKLDCAYLIRLSSKPRKIILGVFPRPLKSATTILRRCTALTSCATWTHLIWRTSWRRTRGALTSASAATPPPCACPCSTSPAPCPPTWRTPSLSTGVLTPTTLLGWRYVYIPPNSICIGWWKHKHKSRSSLLSLLVTLFELLQGSFRSGLVEH